MNRRDFQALSRVRIAEARALLDAGHYDGACYLAGYAVECALKACIAKQTKAGDFPDRERVLDSYTHNLKKLVETAKLEDDLALAIHQSIIPKVNWEVIQFWSEASRYSRWSKDEASKLVEAVSDSRNGVLRWLRRHW